MKPTKQCKISQKKFTVGPGGRSHHRPPPLNTPLGVLYNFWDTVYMLRWMQAAAELICHASSSSYLCLHCVCHRLQVVEVSAVYRQPVRVQHVHSFVKHVVFSCIVYFVFCNWICGLIALILAGALIGRPHGCNETKLNCFSDAITTAKIATLIQFCSCFIFAVVWIP